MKACSIQSAEVKFSLKKKIEFEYPSLQVINLTFQRQFFFHNLIKSTHAKSEKKINMAPFTNAMMLGATE